ncbi:unnamed protein product [Somion occarium]|uniref:Major facilitator superfamily (MFS) profile domain-containing protein n=1 Tax=Somion occarium TaxID=3059160 RepID=A0ABP1DI00_9APHY
MFRSTSPVGKVLSESSFDDSEKLSFDAAEEKAAVRRLDYSILPLVTMFYLLSFLDRANIGNARVAGLQKGLHLTDHQYQVAVTVTFVPYIMAELPANLLLRKVGPSLLMPLLLVIWGIIVTLQGVVTSYAGLVTIRAFLGLCEGPMFPGIVLYLSGFYTREELSLRVALFFSSASLSGAFSGLLAAAIQNMHGVGGKPGWAWIFILEGLFTVLVGVVAFFLVPSTLQDSKFLTQRQKDIIMVRLARDRPAVNVVEEFSVKEIMRSLRSPHVILLFIQLFCTGFLVILCSAYLSDRYHSRAIPTMIIALLAVIGYAMFLGVSHPYVAYGSLFLSVPGVYATAPLLSAWMANNSEPYYRRATSVAIGFVATNAGGILATWSYPTKEGPRFQRTTIMNLTFSVIVIVGAAINAKYLSRENDRKTQRRAELLAPYTNDEHSDGGEKAWLDLGDRHPDFRYSL